MTARPVLPDVLQPGLSIVFCGSAAGAASARAGAYYAGPGNRFWPTLHEVGLTPRLIPPIDFRMLPEHGMGLTDMAKHASGSDAALPRGSDDPEALKQRILAIRPRILAFVGKRAGNVFLRTEFDLHTVTYGEQTVTLSDIKLFVLPSTSGAARRFWDIGPWHALAQAARDAENST